jgi:hypothetical protein
MSSNEYISTTKSQSQPTIGVETAKYYFDFTQPLIAGHAVVKMGTHLGGGNGTHPEHQVKEAKINYAGYNFNCRGPVWGKKCI